MTDEQFDEVIDVITFWVFAALTGAFIGLIAGASTW